MPTQSLFDLVDEAQLKAGPIDLLKPLRTHKAWREFAFLISLWASAMWAICGWDSTIDQLWGSPYGVGFHYHNIVIYCLAYWYLSRNLEINLGIKRSENIFITAGIVLLSVGLFEWIWLALYATFQHQPWVLWPRLPQLKLLIRNAFCVIAGLLSIAWLSTARYYLPRPSRSTLILALLTLSAFALWIYYPFPVETLTVKLADGSTWQSSNRFPQTLYTISITGEAAGTAFHVNDPLVHLLNVLAKTFITLLIISLYR